MQSISFNSLAIPKSTWSIIITYEEDIKLVFISLQYQLCWMSFFRIAATWIFAQIQFIFLFCYICSSFMRMNSKWMMPSLLILFFYLFVRMCRCFDCLFLAYNVQKMLINSKLFTLEFLIRHLRYIFKHMANQTQKMPFIYITSKHINNIVCVILIILNTFFYFVFIVGRNYCNP